MNIPENRDTPVTQTDFGVDHSDRNELESANGNVAPTDPWDIDGILEAFRAMPEGERRDRFLHLLIAAHDENAQTRKELKNHEAEDRQEFLVIHDELEYIAACQALILKERGITLPPRAANRPRRRE